MGMHQVDNDPDSEHLRFFPVYMDRINRAMQKADDLDQMMRDVLDVVLDIFDCDRAFLMYPCDPEADSWSIPMERTKPEYPGAGTLNAQIPMDTEIAENLRLLLAREGALKSGPGMEHPLPSQIAEQFGFRSVMATALHTKADRAWVFGIHQCAYDRVWTEEEERLLLEIGRRLADALTSLLVMRHLRESEEKYRRFVETSNEGIMMLDQDGRISFVNARMAEMMGYTEEELIGKLATDFMFADQVADHERQIVSRRQGISENYERHIRCKNGGELWASISATPILNGDGGFQGSFGMLTDITERKRAEKALQQSEEALREAQRIAHLGSWHMDLATNQVFWSEELYRMYGYDPSCPPPLYTESAKLFTPESWERLSSAIAQAVETGTSYVLELEMVPKNGDRKWMLARGELVRDAQGRPVRLRGVVQDITERKQTEKELLANEQLFRALVENSPDFIARYDLDCHRVYVNPAIRRLFKEPQGNVLGKSPLEESPVQTPQDYIDHLRKVIQTGSESTLETQFRTTEGKMHWGHIRFTPEFGADGKVASVLTIGRDIDEIKQAEMELAFSQEKFSKAFHASPNLMAITSPDGRIVEINESFCRFFGYTRDECLGHSTAELHMWVDPEQRSSVLQQLEEAEGALYIPVELRTKSGEIRSVIDSMAFITIDHQKYLLSVATDITERKRNEAINASRLHLVQFSLTHSLDELFEETINEVEKLTGSHIGFYHVVGEDRGSLTLQNWSTRTKTDACKADGKGRHHAVDEAGVWADCVHQCKPVIHNDYASLPHRKGLPEEHAEVVRELVVPVFRGEMITAILGVGNKPTEYTDEDINTVSLIADQAWEIAERKKVEEKLQHSQTRLAEAQHTAKLGNWELDLRTDELIWSDEALGIFEVDKPSGRETRETFLAIVHPDDRDMVTHARAEALESRDSYEISYRLQMRDGRIKFVQEQGHIDGGGGDKPMRLVGIVQDISHLHEVEEQLHQAQKMEALGTLVGGIAHDFNNKLAAITGNLYLAQRNIADSLETTARLKVVEKLSFEAAAIVQQLLTFARKGRVEQAPLTLVSFIKETAKLNRLAIPENIAFSVEHGDNPLPIMGDITQLQQLFLNLLANARDALDGVEHGRIDVSLQSYEPDTDFRTRHPEGANIKAFARMQVRDNGHGIAPEHLEQIFDPFFTTKEVGKGTGLGLAMVYGVVQSHRGIIEVESLPGKGTCFSIYLPLHHDAKAIPVSHAREEIVKGHGETILLADDDAHVLRTFADMLTSIQYRVLTARNGREAIELFRQHATEIKLVILDIVMPGITGPQVAEAIREIDPDAKVLFATGYDSAQKNAGITIDAEILEKPFAMDAVSRIIRRSLDQGD